MANGQALSVPSYGGGGGSSGPSPVLMIAGLAGLAGLGYLGYQYWYKPHQMKKALSRYVAQTGKPPKDALAALGKAGCEAFGMYYGVPPQASGGICEEAGGMAADIARALPGIIGGTLEASGSGTAALGRGIGTAVGAIGQGAGQAVAGIGQGVGAGISGVTAGLLDASKAPIQLVSYGVGEVYGGAKTVVNDVYSGAKTVVSEVGNTLSNVGSSIASIFSW